MSKHVLIIGSGFAGISAATHLAQAGYRVTVVEKNEAAGGRASVLRDRGFTFDIGPSWYWMPDVFEGYFARFGKQVSDYYDLVRLDPGYQVIYGRDNVLRIPAQMEALRAMFEEIEPGSAEKLDRFLADAAYKYRVGINKLVYKPGQSLGELLDWEMLTGLFRLQVFRSISHEVRRHFKNPRLVQLLEFPVLFLGATAKEIPALYSLMNYADLVLGTWYPMGGMYKIVEGMVAVAEEQGVKFCYNSAVERIEVKGRKAIGAVVNGELITADIIIGGADYHHVEQHLLPEHYRMYSPKYWQKRVMAPGSLLFFLGIDGRIPGLEHHTLLFDESMDDHADAIYRNPRWPERPLLYVSATSKTDPSVAPPGMENLVVLIPLAPGLDDTNEVRERYYNIVMDRLEFHTGSQIRSKVMVKHSFAHRDFESRYNAYKGNAYGLANTLLQTAHLKPSMRNKKLDNLYYTGQLTVPGPGVPPSLISGKVVADLVCRRHPNPL